MPDPSELDRAVEHALTMVFERRGYDFREYQSPFVIRRLRGIAENHGMSGDLPELAARVGEDPVLIQEVIDSLSLGVTELFRDPPFWSALRTSVIPALASGSVVRAWVVGCSTGEEAYSLAMVMRESGLADSQWRIYATDIDHKALAQGRIGSLGEATLQTAEQNYAQAGGTRTLADHLSSDRRRVEVDETLRDRIVFAHHNLVSDARFHSFDLVLCRNVLIYFNANLHRHAHETLFASLVPQGVLGLGSRESLRGSPHHAHFETVDGAARLYRRTW